MACELYSSRFTTSLHDVTQADLLLKESLLLEEDTVGSFRLESFNGGRVPGGGSHILLLNFQPLHLKVPNRILDLQESSIQVNLVIIINLLDFLLVYGMQLRLCSDRFVL